MVIFYTAIAIIFIITVITLVGFLKIILSSSPLSLELLEDPLCFSLLSLLPFVNELDCNSSDNSDLTLGSNLSTNLPNKLSNTLIREVNCRIVAALVVRAFLIAPLFLFSAPAVGLRCVLFRSFEQTYKYSSYFYLNIWNMAVLHYILISVCGSNHKQL